MTEDAAAHGGPAREGRAARPCGGPFTHGRRSASPGWCGLVCLLAVTWTATLPSPSSAQIGRFPDVPDWASDETLLLANAALGALTAGVTRLIRGEPVLSGLPGGALGGALGYAGRRVAVEDFDGAGFLGREINAVGASVTRNAGRSDGWLDELVLPLGPMHLYLGLADDRPTRLRADLNDIGWLIWAWADPQLGIEWDDSFSLGTPVFRTSGGSLRQGGEAVHGLAVGGVILLDEQAGTAVLDHELVHVLELDFVQHTAGAPLERAALDHFFPGAEWTGYLDPSVLSSAVVGLAALLGTRDPGGFLEAEALFLEGR